MAKHVYTVTAEITFTFDKVQDPWNPKDVREFAMEGGVTGSINLLAADVDDARTKFNYYAAYKIAQASVSQHTVRLGGTRFVGAGEVAIKDVKFVSIDRVFADVQEYGTK